MFEASIAYVRGQRDRHLRELREFLSIPSISTLPENRGDIARTANWLREHLARLGMTQAEVMPTAGHPIVYAQWLQAPGKPTVLVYGHYDVQPVDPLGEWDSDPFAGEIRGENIHARGASDDKGQIFAVLKAVEALMEDGGLPVNMKFLFEGEEEIGSAHLDRFIDENVGLLACDFVLNCDASIMNPARPAITYALRGLVYFELELRGPARDLHSGIFGGVVHNPAQALCELLAAMHDNCGRVTLPGFYDKVREIDDDERAALARSAVSDAELLRLTGAPGLWGEKEYTPTERMGARPTLEVNGLVSGFTGEGAKTVLPARALAKISARLVPDQDPADIEHMLRAYLAENVPETLTWELRELSRGPGAVMERDSAAMRAAMDAVKEVFGAEPVFRREGGSVPVVAVLKEKLGVDTIMLGFALADDGIHGPNEKQHLPTLFKGIETYIRFLTSL